MFTDCHMHTMFSTDSDAAPEAMVEAAIDKGLEAICFTDHEDKDYVCEGKKFEIDAVQYMKKMKEIRERYQDQIDVRIGVEIGLQPHLSEFYREYLQAYPFDFVIGSVHVIGGRDPYYKEFFENRSDEEAYLETFEETLKNIRAFSDFDSLGHLDYVVRYGKDREKQYSYEKFAPVIDAILQFLVEHGKGLELNTAGLKYGLPFAHPYPDILKRYRVLGGEIVTVGADAHKPEHVAYEFEKVNGILKDCGFKYYTEFIERKPVFKRIL